MAAWEDISAFFNLLFWKIGNFSDTFDRQIAPGSCVYVIETAEYIKFANIDQEKEK